MTVREILRMGDPRLLRMAEPVREFNTPELHALIADMFDTMHAANGAGLAAPQIGVNLQVVIYGFKQNARYPDAPQVPETVLINPVLTPLSERKEEGFEGCLSVPGLRGSVPRWSELHYEGFDQFGQPISRDCDGFHARVVQHEVDHLHGILYPMRIVDFTQFGYTEVMFPDLDPNDDD
ncbi:Peptide deformylase [compost metagenome]|uniref:peptide deformylase n=1 Tax=Janthinobacterium sp. RT4P48 TaxID=3424188 RepID=UPI000FB1A784